MPIYTLFAQVELFPAGAAVDVTASTLKASGDLTVSGNRDNALAFGDTAAATASIELVDTPAIAGYAWRNMQVRIQFNVNAAGLTKAFVGIARGRTRKGGRITYKCEGFFRLLEETKAYSPIFVRRPCFTKTTSSSIEDPTAPGYAAGLGNYLLWQAGGRPVEQNGNATYAAAARFWYSCAHAQLAPGHGWTQGDNAYTELRRLAEASGGQLYQAPDGVVTYRQPFAVADGAETFTFDESTYGDATEEASGDEVATKVICPFTRRDERPVQDIAEETTPRFVEPGDQAVITIEPSWPIVAYELTDQGTLDPALLTICANNHAPVDPSAYTQVVDADAARLQITITNISSKPFTIYAVKVRGAPVTAGEPGSFTVGTGTSERLLAANDLIQDETHAERLAHMVAAFYAVERPLITVTGCPPSTARFVGERVRFTRRLWGMVNVPCSIVAVRHDRSGQVFEYDLIPVGDLPKTGDFYLVGTTDYSGQTKRLAW